MTGPILDPPLDAAIYKAADERLSWKDSKDGQSLILIDDDSDIDYGLLEQLLSVEARRASLPSTPVIQKLSNLTRNGTIEVFKKAKVFVDLFLPGKERSGFEAALFGPFFA